VTLAIIVALLALCMWLALKLSTVARDNANLRAHIHSLKRQLLRLR
jgi:hypothetical protein